MIFNRSFRFKIIFYITTAFLVIMAVNSYLSINSMYEHLIERSKQNILTNLHSASKEIEEKNEVVVSTVKTLALTQEGGYFGLRNQTVPAIKSVVVNNKDFYDTYVIYEPNADGQDALYKNKEWHDSTGRFNAVWNNVNGNFEFVHGIDMETSLYYNGVKENFLSGAKDRYMITEPYYYNNIMMIEHTYPIVINNKFMGIAGADRKLEKINTFLKNLKPYQTADFLLISRLGGIVVCTDDPSQHTKKYTEIMQKDILQQLIDNPRDNIISSWDPREKREYFFAMERIKTGNWKLFMRVSKDELLDPIYKTINSLIIISTAFFILLFILLVWLVNSVTKPVALAAIAAERVANGDLTQELESTTQDEGGRLLRSIQYMTDNLDTIIKHVNSTVNHVAASASEIFASTQNLNRVASQQTGFTNEVLTSTHQISSASISLAEAMNSVSDVSKQSLFSAQSSNIYLEKMGSAINQMTQASTNISKKLADINDKAGKINSIIETINNITDRINILSLNAAIEAEKAGEFGKGFNIVAREMRHLADQTSIGTMSIDSMIKEMQSAVSTGVMEMDKFISEVNKGAEEMSGVNDKLNEIIKQVEEITPRFNEINNSMQFQLQGTQHIMKSVDELSKGANTIEDSLKEFVFVTSELKHESEALKQEIAKFKLKS